MSAPECSESRGGETCRVRGPHALHVGGYGSSRLQWPNEDFIDPRERAHIEDHAQALNTLAHRVQTHRRTGIDPA